METEVLFVDSLAPKGEGTLFSALSKCCSGDGVKRAIVFNVSGTIVFPSDSRWSSPEDCNGARICNLSDVVVCGDTAPGRIVITGHPYVLEDMNDVTWRGITWALEAPPLSGYASYWGPVRAVSGTGRTSVNVGFVNCSFVGGEDETPFGPNDWKERDSYSDRLGYVCPAFKRLVFKNCFFGYGTSAYRPAHNFSLMKTCVEDSVTVGCFFAHNNRRNEQVEGYRNLFCGNVVYNAGTMYFGVLSGSVAAISNLFVPGNQSRQTAPHVLPIQVAQSGRSGPVRIGLHGNRRLGYGRIPELTINDASMCDNQMQLSFPMTVVSLDVTHPDVAGYLQRYPDCWKALDSIGSAGAPGCPYAALAAYGMKVSDLRKPWVHGMLREGNWIPAVNGRLADLGIQFPSPFHYRSTAWKSSYDQIVSGAY